MKKESRQKNVFGNILLGISLIFVMIYFVFVLIDSSNQVEQIKTILLSGIFTVVTILFVFTAMTANQKGSKYALFASLGLIAYSGIALLSFLGIVTFPRQKTVPNFVNQMFTEAVTWANENKVSLEETYEYSDMVEEYHIIYQNATPETLTKKIKSLSVVVSSGADPEKEVTIPNMIGWKAEEVLAFIQKNFLTNVEVEFIVSDKTKDTVIEQDGTGAKKRNDHIKLVFSIGKEEDIKEFKMADLIDKSKFEATFYLKQHGVTTYETPEDYSKYKRGNVMKQNIAPGKTVKPKEDKVIVTISKGQKITVPDLSKMSVKEITEWITKNRLKISFQEQYDDSIKEGYPIKTSHKKGDSVEEGTTIEVVVSKGKLTMPSNISLSDFKTWAEKYGILYIENYEFNDSVAQGEVINWSHKPGQTIKNGEQVTITVSEGTAVEVPNFEGMSKSAIQKKCNSLGINCTFQYRYSNSVEEGVAMDQSKEAGSKVAKGSSIDITLSNGKRPSGGNSGNSGSGNSGGNEEPAPPSCTGDATYTLVLQPSWVTGGSVNATISTLRSKLSSRYPKITFNFVTRDGNQPAGYIHEDSPITNGSTIKDCNTYTIIINN